MSASPAILFTAFEPSGDALAAVLIAALKQGRPELAIHALGGPRMAAAGAELIEATTDQPVMLLSAARQALVHRARLKRLDAFLRRHPVAAFVPTDSPAANWSVCKLVRRRCPEARIVHLAAPQLWAWAPWRIHKLRRLTDHLLCLLPFEPDWFEQRGVPATFVGHPLFDERRADAVAAREAASRGDGPSEVRNPQSELVPPRLALLPGSRSAEVRANAATMLAVACEMERRVPGLVVEVAAADAIRERLMRDMLDRVTGPTQLLITTGRADDVLSRADAALVVSGTATLHAAVHRTPMVVVYRAGWLAWQAIGRWIVSTRTFSLPNLIARGQGRGRVVPEHVPHFGDVGELVRDLEPLVTDAAAREAQRAALDEVIAPFIETRFAEAAPAALLRVMDRLS
ncbi:MAG: hypothetical protein WD009_06510 [Phycisphaeraceae bacterium]